MMKYLAKIEQIVCKINGGYMSSCGGGRVFVCVVCSADVTCHIVAQSECSVMVDTM